MAKKTGSGRGPGRPKGISKKGVTLSPQGFPGGINHPGSGANAFSTGVKKEASLTKEGEFQVTQTNSFFYSPELNTMGS